MIYAGVISDVLGHMSSDICWCKGCRCVRTFLDWEACKGTPILEGVTINTC